MTYGPFSYTTHDSNNNFVSGTITFTDNGNLSVTVVWVENMGAGRDYTAAPATSTQTLWATDGSTSYTQSPIVVMTNTNTTMTATGTFSGLPAGSYSQFTLHLTANGQAGMDNTYGNSNHTTTLFSIAAPSPLSIALRRNY